MSTKKTVQDAWARWKIGRIEDQLSSLPSGAGNAVNGYRDRYVIADAVTTTYPLTLTPRKDTLNLFLNGLALDEGVDYSVDYTGPSITLTSSATRAVGDVMWARYLTASDIPEISTILTWGIRSDTAQLIGGFDAVALIDSGTAFTDIEADLVNAGSSEIDLVFGAANLMPDTSVDTDYLFLRVTTAGSSGLWHFNRVSGVDSDTLIHSIGAATTPATYQVTCSGTTLTVKQNASTIDTVVLTGADAAALSRSIVGIRGAATSPGTVANFTANGGAVTDSMSRPNADQLGHADTGQTWVGTS